MENHNSSSTYIENDNKNFRICVKHKKCGLVNKVREQICNAENKYCARNPSYSFLNCCERVFGCWAHSVCCILVILSVLALAWACILYGTVIGAALCTHVNNGQFVPWFKIPGLTWQSKSDDRLWKVF